MRRLIVSGQYFFGALAVGFLGLGLFVWSGKGAPAGNGFYLDAARKSFGTAPENTLLSVEFTLVNETDRPVRILGSTSVCTPQGCLFVEEKLPLEVRAHSRKEINISIKTNHNGTYYCAIKLYTDCAENPQLLLGVEGRVSNTANQPIGDSVKS